MERLMGEWLKFEKSDPDKCNIELEVSCPACWALATPTGYLGSHRNKEHVVLGLCVCSLCLPLAMLTWPPGSVPSIKHGHLIWFNLVWLAFFCVGGAASPKIFPNNKLLSKTFMWKAYDRFPKLYQPVLSKLLGRERKLEHAWFPGQHFK